VRKIEIPKREWSGKLDELGRRHEGWLVSLDITMAQSVGAQREFHQMPLTGITAEPTAGGMIAIAVEEPDGDHLTHMIHGPRHVFLETTKTGADSMLQIDSADGTKAVLHFRSEHAA
jgi:hypothetical protein